jgi:uncharacterized membrane protein
MMYGYDGTHMGAGGWFLMAFTTLAFWVAALTLLVWVVRSSVPRTPRHDGRQDPTKVLARRFAHGEIDADEYVERLRILKREDD